MKKVLLILFVGVLAHVGFGQKHFKIKSSVNKPIEIKVNGKVYTIDSTYQEIETHYPEFDSLILTWEKRNTTKDPIICNFKPDSTYSIYHSCCASLDIYPTSEVEHDSIKNWDFEEDFDKIQSLMLDHPKFTFTTNGELNDSIYAWYVDYACMPSFNLVDKKGWDYGSPIKCYYWTNISSFRFFNIQKDFSKFQDENGIVNDVYPDNELSNTYKLLGQISVRLFDNKSYIINYDIKTNKVSLYYDKLK